MDGYHGSHVARDQQHDESGGLVFSRDRHGSQVGDQLPDATVYEGTPKDAIKIRDLFAGKKGVLFGVPGASLYLL